MLWELDLKLGDVVADIGAGDGFWAEKMAEAVGPSGTIHAGEVSQDKVDKMKKRFADLPQVKPYLCPLDGPGLEENTCDVAFLSKSYHHLDKDGLVKYLDDLRSVVKPTGRLVVIEHYQELATGRMKDHSWSPGLPHAAGRARWVDPRAIRTDHRDPSFHGDLRPEGVVWHQGAREVAGRNIQGSGGENTAPHFSLRKCQNSPSGFSWWQSVHLSIGPSWP